MEGGTLNNIDGSGVRWGSGAAPTVRAEEAEQPTMMLEYGEYHRPGNEYGECRAAFAGVEQNVRSTQHH